MIPNSPAPGLIRFQPEGQHPILIDPEAVIAVGWIDGEALIRIEGVPILTIRLPCTDAEYLALVDLIEAARTAHRLGLPGPAEAYRTS